MKGRANSVVTAHLPPLVVVHYFVVSVALASAIARATCKLRWSNASANPKPFGTKQPNKMSSNSITTINNSLRYNINVISPNRSPGKSAGQAN
jgi:hypothetical protein